ncbi:hypothetical protein DWB61_15240 [Ancylomarina euxinus]|uniref:DUF3592 domain-containing protein n=1 Tax=Ancylomarina euxinus TaxID=2283627 RepID=A0A425XXJ3_9BACT|nr:hypothetical protein [Ancylomarina euxinus]MCZ4694706.1 hypothetical protein [Ancylomarina euxinus]MUP16370.1 hypothetical protein [Ancylomarina euxinus]RRG19401.1 hypothetical protein DWB61_15240 [Ancylomarina euxinus]
MEFRVGTFNKKVVIVLAIICSAIITNILIIIKEENRCEKMIEQRGEYVIGFVRDFVKRQNLGISSKVEYKVNNVTYYTRFRDIEKPFKLDSPVYVKYDPIDPECNILCRDSVVEYKGKTYRYYDRKFHGWNQEIK